MPFLMQVFVLLFAPLLRLDFLGNHPFLDYCQMRTRHDSVAGLERLFTRNPEEAVSVGRSLLRLATPGYYK
ncbi:hypothetical protein MRX96_046740 [Rhipicephalus microplus]